MKYKVGDKIRIKSLKWYNQNKDNNDEVRMSGTNFSFVSFMSDFCGKLAQIVEVTGGGNYILDIDKGYYTWSDFMFEGIVEDKPYKYLLHLVSMDSQVHKTDYVELEKPIDMEYIKNYKPSNLLNSYRIVGFSKFE